MPLSIEDKPYRYKYSLVYIVDNERVVGYDNAEGKGDHKHYGEIEKPYEFKGIEKLLEDFYKDIEKYKRGKHES